MLDIFTAGEAKDEGNKFFKQGDFTGAIEWYSNAVDLYTRSYELISPEDKADVTARAAEARRPDG